MTTMDFTETVDFIDFCEPRDEPTTQEIRGFIGGKLVPVDHSRMTPCVLTGTSEQRAKDLIRIFHYTHSVPSGKSYYVKFGTAIVVWSIPANKNIATFILGFPGNVWELSRLWAPNNHAPNLLTRAISAAVGIIRKLENPDALVSYADPNVGHSGGVYRAASWIYHGKSEETRTYVDKSGQTFSRRKFHSGGRGMRKAEIEALGYKELKLPGKERFVRPLSKRAKRSLTK